MMTAQTDGLKEPAEFWTAIGNKLRPSLTVTVTIGMEVFAPVTAPIVRTDRGETGRADGAGRRGHLAAHTQIFFALVGE